MVLTKWIVPEPNPDLKLSIDTIDYKKLDYEDLRWIYSSTMKKYYREFCNLKGFVQYAERVFYKEDVKSELMQLRSRYIIPKTPVSESVGESVSESVSERECNISLDTHKVLPTRKIPFLKKNDRSDNIIRKYSVKRSDSSEACIVS